MKPVDDMDKLRLCFEVQGLAIDEDGNSCSAGMQIILEGELKKGITYEELTKDLDIPAVLEFFGMEGVADPADIRLITPEEYDKEYGGK